MYQPLKLNELIPKKIFEAINLQPEIYACSKKHHFWNLFVQKLGGLYVPWKFNIAIGPPEKWIGLEVGRRLFVTLRLGGPALFLP